MNIKTILNIEGLEVLDEAVAKELFVEDPEKYEEAEAVIRENTIKKNYKGETLF